MVGSGAIVEEKKIEQSIRQVPGHSFTVLDFIKVFRSIYPEDWEGLVERFGLFGGKRRYTVATYFSNRLDVYSQKPHSILVPFRGYKEGKLTDYRKTTKEERKVFGSPWIAIYKKTGNKH